MIEKIEMEEKLEVLDDDHRDDHVDLEIQDCINKEQPKSFFTYAGAGSGKTRSLVNTLEYIKKQYGVDLNTYSKKVAVITYTNAACEEIINRVDNNPVFFVSTIHSFLWEMIRPYQRDIKKWIKEDLQMKLEETKKAEEKGRKNTQASRDRLSKISKYHKDLEKIDSVISFSYNPNGENIGFGSLNHADVIKMGTQFINEKETMQKVLISRFPILLIDECQDTKKELVDAILHLQKEYCDSLIVGMFGDTMQKIYNDGKENLAECIPEDWVKPIKVMNHRSSKRIVELANAIRSSVDDKMQRCRSDANEGFVRLFISDIVNNPRKIESKVAKRMSEITGDMQWENCNAYQSLILEHQMAAKRIGFFNLFSVLHSNKKLKQSVLDGSLPEARIFSEMVFPLVCAYKNGNKFEVAKIAKKYSPLLSKETLLKESSQMQCIKRANDAVESLCNLFNNSSTPKCFDVVKNIYASGLFELNQNLCSIVDNYQIGKDEVVDTIYSAFNESIEEMKCYCEYSYEKSSFSTHQGVKGLEYPRVMLIMDDDEAEGFMFSYEKLFGVANMTEADMKNEKEGKDNSISRTKRLFYVACTRAKESLALVAYTRDKEALMKTAIDSKWLKNDEIEYIVL